VRMSPRKIKFTRRGTSFWIFDQELGIGRIHSLYPIASVE
jgi:hypothetical protein